MDIVVIRIANQGTAKLKIIEGFTTASRYLCRFDFMALSKPNTDRTNDQTYG